MSVNDALELPVSANEQRVRANMQEILNVIELPVDEKEREEAMLVARTFACLPWDDRVRIIDLHLQVPLEAGPYYDNIERAVGFVTEWEEGGRQEYAMSYVPIMMYTRIIPIWVREIQQVIEVKDDITSQARRVLNHYRGTKVYGADISDRRLDQLTERSKQMRDLGRNLMPKVLNTKYLPGRITAALCESLGILSDDERINVGQELFSRAEQLESLVRDFRSGLGKYDVLKASGFEG